MNQSTMASQQQESISKALAALVETGNQRRSGQMGKRRKSVAISVEPSTIHEIENLEQISEEERSNMWFTREEYSEIKASYLEIITMTRNKEFITDSERHCTRGLECRSKAGSRRRRDTQRNALFAVLGEQERQQAEGIQQVDTLAVIYRQFSFHSQQAATNMGRRDEYEILDYTADTRAQFGISLQSSYTASTTTGGRIRVSAATRSSRSAGSPTRQTNNLRLSSSSNRVKVMLGNNSSRRRAAAA